MSEGLVATLPQSCREFFPILLDHIINLPAMFHHVGKHAAYQNKRATSKITIKYGERRIFRSFRHPGFIKNGAALPRYTTNPVTR